MRRRVAARLRPRLPRLLLLRLLRLLLAAPAAWRGPPHGRPDDRARRLQALCTAAGPSTSGRCWRGCWRGCRTHRWRRERWRGWLVDHRDQGRQAEPLRYARARAGRLRARVAAGRREQDQPDRPGGWVGQRLATYDPVARTRRSCSTVLRGLLASAQRPRPSSCAREASGAARRTSLRASPSQASPA